MNRLLRGIGIATLTVAVGLSALFGLDVFKPLRVRWANKLIFANPDSVRDAFLVLFHEKGNSTYSELRWFGSHILKTPMDLLIYQEILNELKPDVVVETGTYKGGSALFVAHMMDLIGKGRVVTIDIEAYPEVPKHDRITYLVGSSTDPGIVQQVKDAIRPGETVMVLLDSDHSMKHVLNEIHAYHELVTPGSYLVVEDTHLSGHPVLPKMGPGPREAADQFLAENSNFVVDSAREKLIVTFNPRGYLRRVR